MKCYIRCLHVISPLENAPENVAILRAKARMVQDVYTLYITDSSKYIKNLLIKYC